MNMDSIIEKFEEKLKDLDFEMKELRDNEPAEYKKLSKILDQRMYQLSKIKSTSVPPQLSLMVQGMKRTEEINIIDANIGLLQWVIKLLKEQS